GGRRPTRLDAARLFLVAIRARALIAAAAGACLADHADSVSAAPALVHGRHDEPSPVEAAKARAAEVVAAPPVALSPATLWLRGLSKRWLGTGGPARCR